MRVRIVETVLSSQVRGTAPAGGCSDYSKHRLGKPGHLPAPSVVGPPAYTPVRMPFEDTRPVDAG
jgi:hypothetical protein